MRKIEYLQSVQDERGEDRPISWEGGAAEERRSASGIDPTKEIGLTYSKDLEARGVSVPKSDSTMDGVSRKKRKGKGNENKKLAWRTLSDGVDWAR